MDAVRHFFFGNLYNYIQEDRGKQWKTTSKETRTHRVTQSSHTYMRQHKHAHTPRHAKLDPTTHT